MGTFFCNIKVLRNNTVTKIHINIMIIIKDEIKIRCTVAGSKSYEILPVEIKLDNLNRKVLFS